MTQQIFSGTTSSAAAKEDSSNATPPSLHRTAVFFRFINRFINPGLFGGKKPKIKTGCFPLKETFFLWRLRFSVSILYHLGCIFGRNSAFIFVFVKLSGGLCKTKKLLPSVSSGKKGLEVLKSTFVTFGTFSLLDWFYIRLRLFLLKLV